MARLALARAIDFPRGRSAPRRGARGQPEPGRGARHARGDGAARDGHRRPRTSSSTPRSRSTRTTSRRSACAPRCASWPTTRPASRRPSARCSRATRATRACTASSPSTPSGSTATTSWWRWRARRSRIDPEDALAYATLGINLLRAGRREGRPRRAARGLGARPLQRAGLQHAQLLRAGARPGVRRASRRAPFVLRMHKDERARARAVRGADAARAPTRTCASATRFTPERPAAHRALRRHAALLGAHHRPAQRRRAGRVLRQGDHRALAARRPVQLGADHLARARPRVPPAAEQEPRAALVHRGPGRVRDDHRAPRVEARRGLRRCGSRSSRTACPRCAS